MNFMQVINATLARCLFAPWNIKRKIKNVALTFILINNVQKRTEPLSHHHHQFLLLLVEHRASMKSFHALRSPAIPLISFHDLPVFLISSSIVLRHVLFDLLVLLYPWGFQSNAVLSIDPASLRNVCPSQFHFLLFIWISFGFSLVILHSSSFVILSVHFIFIIRLKHLFINVCNLLVIWTPKQPYVPSEKKFLRRFQHNGTLFMKVR